MIYRTDLVYSAEGTENILSGFGVKLHGAIMNLIPRRYAQELHKTEYQPFSICARRKENIIAVSVYALNEEAAVICRETAKARELNIYGMDFPLRQYFSTLSLPFTAEEAEKSLPENIRFTIVTPAMLKMNKIPSCPPTPERYFRSVCEKYALYEGEQIAYEEYRLLFSRLKISNFELSGTSYNIAGSIYPGMTGFIDLSLPLNTMTDNTILRKIIAYSQFTGIGAKTAMGMGGVEITSLK